MDEEYLCPVCKAPTLTWVDSEGDALNGFTDIYKCVKCGEEVKDPSYV